MVNPDRKPVEFWSSVEYGTFLDGLVAALSADGVLARQRFGVGETVYRGARGKLARIGMRWRCYVGYPLGLRRRVRREPSAGALVVCTNTFYAPAVALRAARGRPAPVVHWVFDLYPDVLLQSGKVRAGGWIERRLHRLTAWTFARADANVFLGRRLLEHAELRFGPVPRNVVIPVGADARPFREVRPLPGAPQVLYCGNFGRMHDTATLAGLLRETEGVPEGCALRVCGNGAGYAEVRAAAAAGTPRVCFEGNLPGPAWIEAMESASIGLVTLKPGCEGVVMPSKTYSAMAAGQAILAVCPRASDLADTVLAHEAGWVVEPGDVRGLRGILEHLGRHPDEVLARRRNAQRAARTRYDQPVLARRWRELLAGLADGAQRAPRDEAGCKK